MFYTNIFKVPEVQKEQQLPEEKIRRTIHKKDIVPTVEGIINICLDGLSFFTLLISCVP